MQRTRNYPPIGALVRGLDVLMAISALEATAVGAIHKRTGISKPTIVRNLETLEHTGYVSHDESTGLYSLTARVLCLSEGYNRGRRLVELATPILSAYRRSMPWPSDLAFFDTDAMVIVETNRDPGTLALNRPVGSRLPMLTSALGRAYLAFCSDQQRQDVLDRCIGDGPGSSKERKAIVRMLARFRSQGFSENDQSLSPSTRGVAVPVIVNGSVEACVNTIMLSESMAMNEVVDRCIPPLKTIVAQIADALAGDLCGPDASTGQAV